MKTEWTYIRISKNTRKALNEYKIIPRDTYEAVIQKMIKAIEENEPKK